MGEMGEGWRSEVRGFRNFEPELRTSDLAFLTCHAPGAGCRVSVLYLNRMFHGVGDCSDSSRRGKINRYLKDQ